MSMPKQSLGELSADRYALLRSFRRDGSPVDAPTWFGLDDEALLFRTKVGRDRGLWADTVIVRVLP